MATESNSPRPVFWSSLLIAAFLGGLIGAVIAGNRLAGESDFLGLKRAAFVLMTAYFGAIATGLIWLPLLAWCRIGQPKKERVGGYILIPAVFAFVVALVPTGDALVKRGKTLHLEQQVLGALTAPKGTASPWDGIDTSLPAVGGHTVLWLLRTPSVPAWKLDELAAIFPNNPGIATQIARQTECPARPIRPACRNCDGYTTGATSTRSVTT
jgi:MFS family permease